jgi:hypothetical protein
MAAMALLAVIMLLTSRTWTSGELVPIGERHDLTAGRHFLSPSVA